MTRSVAFTGLQPTGALHLGNYLGAIRPWVRAQSRFRGYFAVVDLHAMTSLPEPRALQAATREVAALCLASGVDAERGVLFVQSHVAEHAELAWLLGCMCPAGWLLRMIQFRDRAGRQAEPPGTGVLVYPVLMAADILLYGADTVLVGEDQRQHLELCRSLARRANARHPGLFVEPSADVPAAGARVMALDDPRSKMSKSSPGRHHRIGLLDGPDQVRAAIARAVTDSGNEVAYDPEQRPGLANLVAIEAALADVSPYEIARRYEGKRYGDLKRDLAEHLIDVLAPIQERHRELVSDPAALDALLARGAERARSVASATLGRVRDAVGLVAPALATPAAGTPESVRLLRKRISG